MYEYYAHNDLASIFEGELRNRLLEDEAEEKAALEEAIAVTVILSSSHIE